MFRHPNADEICKERKKKNKKQTKKSSRDSSDTVMLDYDLHYLSYFPYSGPSGTGLTPYTKENE